MQTATKKPKRLRWTVGIGLIVAAMAALAFWAVASPGALAYYKSPTEVATQTPSASQNIRVGGRVHHLERGAGYANFTLGDDKHTVRIEYRGEVPDTLKDGTDGIAEGHMTSAGTMHADRVQAKCSSKYMTKTDRTKTLGTG